MALQLTRLTELIYIPATAGSLYANPASTKSLVRGIMLHNTNTTAETVTLYLVPDSAGAVGTAASANQFAKIVLQPNETLLFEIPYCLVMLDTNDTLQGVTTTASKVTCAIIGDQDA